VLLQTLSSLAPALSLENSHFVESLKSQRRLRIFSSTRCLCTRVPAMKQNEGTSILLMEDFPVNAAEAIYTAACP